MPRNKILATLIGLILLTGIIALLWFYVYPVLGNLLTSISEGVTVE